jgi:SAM-dependent methyltransferase
LTLDHQDGPDVASSSRQYARRFSGASGAWMLSVQRDATLAMVDDWPKATVLDIGGGHGQLAPALHGAGYKVSVLGSGPLAFEQLRTFPEASAIEEIVGDLENPPLENDSVDVVMAFRMMPHVTDWRRLIAGMCRVARHAVIVEFPLAVGFNALSRSLFAVKKKIEGDTRPFALFNETDVVQELLRHGFEKSERFAEFWLPLALHRMMGWRAASEFLERTGRTAGLTPRFGSPLILCATRLRD